MATGQIYLYHRRPGTLHRCMHVSRPPLATQDRRTSAFTASVSLLLSVLDTGQLGEIPGKTVK